MKQEKVPSTASKVMCVIFHAAFILLVLIFALMSPYDASFPDLKQIDYDKLDVLKVAWMFLAGADGVIWAISKPKKLWRHLLYGAIMLLAVIKLVSLFLMV